MEIVAKQRPVLARSCVPASEWKTACRNSSKKHCRCRKFLRICLKFYAAHHRRGRTSCGPLLPLHAARRMRPHDGTGAGVRFDAMAQLREMLRTGQPRQAASVVGLLSRLDVPRCLNCCPRGCRSGTVFITTWWCDRLLTARRTIADARCWSCWKFWIRWCCRRQSMRSA